MTHLTCISKNQITKAAGRLRDFAVATPVLSHPALDERAGARVFLKLENLQRTGSFKFRGAFNKLSTLQSPPGSPIVAWSSGNHAQGVACAAKLLQRPAHIVMPADAPLVKKHNTAAYGATIVEYDRYNESRENIGRNLAEELGADIIAPYDDYDVMAGQGTCGMEFISQCKQIEVSLDAVLTCCGGGGLTAGVASAFHGWSPQTEIYAVEPQTCNDHARSLAEGHRVANGPNATSICDALLAPTPGELTFPINQHLLTGALSVTDAQVIAAIRYAYETLSLVVEPGGAAALAALLSDKLPRSYTSIGVVITGGNIDAEQFARYITS